MSPGRGPLDVGQYLRDCRILALEEIRRFIPQGSPLRAGFYDLMLDYPLREAKGLRPALCLAACRALGGSVDAALPSAAVIELYHNAFLVHDDVEDASTDRRNLPTLHREHGIPIAINVGDGMLALAIEPLLANMQRIGLSRALRVLQAVAQMARETAEGQAIELGWIRQHTWELGDADYDEMVVKKTAWYSFMAPMQLGAIIAGAPDRAIDLLARAGRALGIAFQIRDDILNLHTAERAYGKEHQGDLWEGKRTLILLHMLRSVGAEQRASAVRILARVRPDAAEVQGACDEALLAALHASGDVSDRALGLLRAHRATGAGPALERKTESDVAQLRALIDDCGSIAYADAACRRHSEEAQALLTRADEWLVPSVHRDFLHALVDFTVRRTH